jgi:hypothetical protein
MWRRDRCIIIGGIVLIAAIALSSSDADRSIFLAATAAETGIAPDRAHDERAGGRGGNLEEPVAIEREGRQLQCRPHSDSDEREIPLPMAEDEIVGNE